VRLDLDSALEMTSKGQELSQFLDDQFMSALFISIVGDIERVRGHFEVTVSSLEKGAEIFHLAENYNNESVVPYSNG
jgi:hypothetical protein